MKKVTPVCCFLVGLMGLVAAFVAPTQINSTSLLAASLAFGFLSNVKE